MIYNVYLHDVHIEEIVQGKKKAKVSVNIL